MCIFGSCPALLFSSALQRHLCNACALPQPSKFILKFDIDGDRQLSFDEFLLFSTLLSIPMDDLEVAFRLMDKGGDSSAPVCRCVLC
jgi:Ca2+-binding EF-hand superfamily protein